MVKIGSFSPKWSKWAKNKKIVVHFFFHRKYSICSLFRIYLWDPPFFREGSHKVWVRSVPFSKGISLQKGLKLGSHIDVVLWSIYARKIWNWLNAILSVRGLFCGPAKTGIGLSIFLLSMLLSTEIFSRSSI